MKRKLFDLWRGIKRHPWQTIGSSFAAFSVLWTLTEAVTHFLSTVKIEGAFLLTLFGALSLAYGLWLVWKPSKIVIKIADTSTRIEVRFGDLFGQEGIRAIAVSEFFDSKLGAPVAEKSLHGAFIKNCFGGGVTSLDQQLDQQLAQTPFSLKPKVDGKNKAYEIGATALVSVGADRYLLFALAHADPQTCKANADVTMMWVALHNLWQRARVECNGHALNLALVGHGLSNIGLPPRDLLNLIILSLITETKASQITQMIRIVLHIDVYEDLDLRTVKRHWEER
jgi:hypothetical protein